MPSWPDAACRRAPGLAAAQYNVARLPGTALVADLSTDAGQPHPPGRGPSLADIVREVFGVDRWIATGSGRGAEAVVATLAGPGQRVLANEVYVSGRWWVERFGATVEALPDVRDSERDLDDVAYVQITAPPAQLGPRSGVAVTLEDLRAVRAWKDRELPHVPLVIDASRLWENAAAGEAHAGDFIDLADIIVASARKDLGCATGGLVVARDDRWWSRLTQAADVLEGPEGGLHPLDLAAIAEGLDLVSHGEVVSRRLAELNRLARTLRAGGVPVSSEGCGSLFLDARAWLPSVPANELPAQTLLNLIYLLTGVRGLGTSTDEAGSVPIVRLAVRGSAELLRDSLPHVAAQARDLTAGFRPLPRDRAAPYLQPAEAVDPTAWPPVGSWPSPATPRATWLTGRSRPGFGPQRALVEAWGRARPGAELRSDDPTLQRLHARLGGTTTVGGRPLIVARSYLDGRATPTVADGPPDLVVVRIASPEDWRPTDTDAKATDAWWASTETGGWLAVRADSLLASALDRGSLFTLGAWLQPRTGG